jgi:ABC-type uncharacterized transport system YnjBCD ATPase subunit
MIVLPHRKPHVLEVDRRGYRGISGIMNQALLQPALPDLARSHHLSRGITALIGPSGCGKNTLLRTFNRVYDMYPDQRATGEISIDGRNILDPRTDLTALRAHVGMTFQKPNPFPMSIFGNIAFGTRRAATAPVHCQGHRAGPGYPAVRRTVLRARPCRDRANRKPAQPIGPAVLRGHHHPQHAAGRAYNGPRGRFG